MNDMRELETTRIRVEVDKASSLVVAATVLARQGRLVSVLSLKKKVGDICDAVKKVGYRDCLPLKESLVELLKRTDAFEREMTLRFSFLTPDNDKDDEK